jgi:RND superfamily putative drug exporter
VIAVLLFMASPLLKVTFNTPDDRALPTSAPSHQVGDILRTDFATAPSAVDVVSQPALTGSNLVRYERALDALPGVQSTTDAGIVSGTQRLTITTSLDSSSGAAQRLVHEIRAVAVPGGTRLLVGGGTAALVDAKQAINSKLALAATIIAATTFILLFLFTGSVMQPVRALVGNALTLGATLGAMVWIFQDGHFSHLLGFTPTATNTSMPVLLFCIAFGLSIDYEVFLMSRIKELHEGGATNADAVTHGLARTGRIVSTAAALLAVSFFAFATSKVSFIQFFGLGTGFAILLDATLVRGVLVPAFMAVFGERSWYAPPLLRRLHNRIGVSDADPSTALGD